MSVELDYKIGQLQYEISILGLDEEELTGVTKRTEELKSLVKKLTIPVVSNWVECKDTKPIDGKEYLISDGEDVTEAQWYDDSKWGGEPYDSYTHYAEKPKPPCL